MSYRLPPGDQRPSEMVELLPEEIMALKNVDMFIDHIERLYKERPLPRDKDGADSHIGWKSELWDGLEALKKAGERLSNNTLYVRDES